MLDGRRGRRDRRAGFHVREGDPKLGIDRQDPVHAPLVEEERLLKVAFNAQDDWEITFIVDDERLVDVLNGEVLRRNRLRDHGERERQDAREPQ